MYPQDGNGWQSPRPQEPRGGNPEPYPSSYPDNGNSNTHQMSAFQPNSAAFEYMRSLDSQPAGNTGPSPPRQRDHPQQRGQSPTAREHSPTPNTRHSRTPRRMRRTARATGTAVALDTPGPPGVAGRLVSDTPMSMPSSRPILVTGPAPNDQMAVTNTGGGPPASSMPGVGVGVYDEEPPPASLYDNNNNNAAPIPTGGLQHEQSDGSYMPAAPYQNMMQSFNNTNASSADPTVERARNIMANRTADNNSNNNAPDARPLPIAGRPIPPETPPLEPSFPAAQLRRRILMDQKPKREPDLVRGKVVKEIASSSKKAHVLCAGCGVMLQISKTAIVVHCRNCNGVHPTASCQLPPRANGR